jgi:hypothetical protein
MCWAPLLFSDPLTQVRTRRAVEKNIHNTPVGIGYLTTLYDASAQGVISEGVIRSIFNDVLPNLAKKFSILCIGSKPSSSPASDWWLEHAGEIARHLSALLRQCMTWKLGWTMDVLIKKIVEEAETAGGDYFTFLYLPFAKHLMTDLESRGVEAQGSPFQNLFQLLLGTWIVEHVWAPKTGWERLTVSCSCIHCKNLNKFLRNGSEPDRGFLLPADSIHHFLQPFQGSDRSRPRPDLTYKFISSVNCVHVTKGRTDDSAFCKWSHR